MTESSGRGCELGCSFENALTNQYTPAKIMERENWVIEVWKSSSRSHDAWWDANAMQNISFEVSFNDSVCHMGQWLLVIARPGTKKWSRATPRKVHNPDWTDVLGPLGHFLHYQCCSAQGH
ncbi:hypothetical protein D5086_020260 [Populus alba]|uniref:Uncharacterized protein n=1 Tax=Populus alba TaxID=43335 RepID=A0ACC4BK65_POPAL